MKTRKKDAGRTRHNLLLAAHEIFAEKGYKEATVADICDKAHAGRAAANYYFGDKANLYSESWRHPLFKSIETLPPDGGVKADAPPGERLRGLVSFLLRRISDKGNKRVFILIKELANPTGLLDQAIRDEVRSENERLGAVVRELLGDRVPETEVQFYLASIITLCVNVIVAETSKEGEEQNRFGLPKIGDIEAYIDHVVRMVLAGILAGSETNPTPPGRKPGLTGNWLS